MRYSQPYGLPDVPAIPPTNPPDGSAWPRYVNGNPVTGTAGSIPPATAFDEDQLEIINVIINAGLIPTHGDVTQLWQALQALFAQRYITTAITKYVHGPGPGGQPQDFADMHAAMDWLSRYIITQSGSVLFMIASGQHAYTTPIEVDHPNANRVTISGYPLTGAAPTPGMFQYTGPHNAGDGTYDYGKLSPTHAGCFATELIFSGGSQGIINYGHGLTIEQLLITGSQSLPPAAPPGQSDQTSATGIVAYADVYLNTITCFGFGNFGIVALQCDVEVRGGPALCCVYNVGSGI